MEEVKKHCIGFHSVDRNNRFFIKLFKKQNNVFNGKKCLRCSELLPGSRFKVSHDFLAHWYAGKNVFQEKPVNYTNLGEIQKYEVTFSQHPHDYDFDNAEMLVDSFLLNVTNRVEKSDSNFFIKCGFSLKNIQLSAFENKEPIKNFRHWSTEPH